MCSLLKAKMSNVVTLAKALGLLAVVYVLKNFSYIVMQSAAAAFPPLQAAAHQALWSFWNFTAFIMTSSEQAFYAYIPAAQAPEEEFAILQLLVRIAIGVGALASSLCATFGLWGVRVRGESRRPSLEGESYEYSDIQTDLSMDYFSMSSSH